MTNFADLIWLSIHNIANVSTGGWQPQKFCIKSWSGIKGSFILNSSHRVFFYLFIFCLAWTKFRKRLSNPNICAACAVCNFLSGASFLGNRMTYLDDIWYVGGASAEVVHAEFWGWLMLIKYLICIIYTKICPEHFSGTVCPTWMIFGMWVGLGPKVRMVIFMEVKGHQRSNGVNYVLWLPCLVKRSHGGQRSSEVKWGKLCAMAIIFGQKKPWCKLRMNDDLDGGQRSSEVKWGKLCAMATIFDQKNCWYKNDDDLYGGQRSSEVKCGKLCAMATIFCLKNLQAKMMMTFTEVKGRQRSNVVKYALWLPYLVKRIADAS